ncbi:MAG: YeeE/YedE family protein [Planctomycetes bacterium GWF2_42_9]|nr:MAG: YeeE/YedE family protein [Planctomycetes bacterium GWF2_42_9]
MMEKIRQKKGLQLIIGLLVGVCFGFLLQKGGVTRYEIIINQLLLKDFTVVKVMLTAIIVGMIGIYLMQSVNLVKFHAKPGSVGQTVIGGLIFGIGFGILGYCPGTVTGAAAQGSLDALLGGMLGLLLGSGAFIALYDTLQKNILQKGYFGEITLPQVIKINKWLLIAIITLILIAILYFLEKAGL